MLVCSVVLRPQGHRIAAAVDESAIATDTTSIGAIYASLTDDPGNARDILDAFTGQRMVEAANAASTVDAASAHPVFVIEEISAAVAAQNAVIGTGPVGGTARNAMADTVMINFDGTARQANANGTMINL